jgi:flagellar protein FliO/FliZ
MTRGAAADSAASPTDMISLPRPMRGPAALAAGCLILSASAPAAAAVPAHHAPRHAQRTHASKPAPQKKPAFLAPVDTKFERAPLDLGSPQAPKAVASVGHGGSLGRTLIGLMIVVALIYGIAWVQRQVKASRDGRARSSGDGLASIASIALAPNRAIHLVRAGNEYLLVGVGEHGVVPLRTYGEDEARALGLLDQPQRGGEPRPPAGGGRGLGAIVEDLRARTVRR